MANFFQNIFTRNKNLNTGQLIIKKTFFSFLIFFLLLAGALWGWKWLRNQSTDGAMRNGIQQPLRKMLNKNEDIFAKLLSKNHLAKQYPISAAVKNVRVNGNLGMDDNFDPKTWELHVIKKSGDTLKLRLADIKKLPKTEIIFDFKCIEGWSQVTHWGGVKFADFAKAYGLDT